MSGIRAEWTKLRTVPSTGWLLLGVAAATVAVGAMATASVHTDQCPSPTECFEDTTKLSLAGVHGGQLMVVVLAVLAMSNEYATGMVRTTLQAMPRRLRVFAAKAIVVTASAMVAAAVGVLASMGVAHLILPGNGFTNLPSLGDEATLRAATGTVLYCGLIAVMSLGLAALLRDTAVAITAVVGLLYVFPIVARFITSARGLELIATYAPMNAGLAVQTTLGLDRAPIGPWAGLGVLAGWTAVVAAAGVGRFVLRDP
jgi:ABC-2 type transport system permease protein